MNEPQKDAVEQKLAGRGARSLPFGGGCAVALGLLLLAMGAVFTAAVGILITASSAASTDDARHVRWLGPPAVLFLVLLGAGLLATGVRDKRRQARAARLAALHPGEPWFSDWAWDPRGALAESEWGGGSILIVAFVLLIMAPFNVLWLTVLDPQAERTLRLFSLMVLIPDFFLYLVLKAVIVVVRDRLRYGRARLRYAAFPFHLGEALDVRLTAPMFAGQENVTATLRCIDERMMSSRNSRGGTVESVAPFQVHQVRQVLPGRFGGRDVWVSLPLPEGPPTELRRQPPRYWELEIAGDTPGDAVRFLVPVYAR